MVSMWVITPIHPIYNWLVLSDEQMSKRWPVSLLNDEQMSNCMGVKHLPDKYVITHLLTIDPNFPGHPSGETSGVGSLRYVFPWYLLCLTLGFLGINFQVSRDYWVYP